MNMDNANKTMSIVKRDGSIVLFDVEKIIAAIKKANNEVDNIHKLSDVQIKAIANGVEEKIKEKDTQPGIEDIQDLVEIGIMEMRGYEVAQKYIRYRYRRQLERAIANIKGGA